MQLEQLFSRPLANWPEPMPLRVLFPVLFHLGIQQLIDLYCTCNCWRRDQKKRDEFRLLFSLFFPSFLCLSSSSTLSLVLPRSPLFSLLSPPNSIFGYEGSAADDIVYINWLNMVRAGLVALEYYTPESKKWGQVSIQPHSRTVPVVQFTYDSEQLSIAWRERPGNKAMYCVCIYMYVSMPSKLMALC